MKNSESEQGSGSGFDPNKSKDTSEKSSRSGGSGVTKRDEKRSPQSTSGSLNHNPLEKGKSYEEEAMEALRRSSGLGELPSRTSVAGHQIPSHIQSFQVQPGHGIAVRPSESRLSMSMRDQSLRLRPSKDMSMNKIEAKPSLLSKLPSMQSAASFVMPNKIGHSMISSKSNKKARERGSLEFFATELTDGEVNTAKKNARKNASFIMQNVASSNDIAATLSAEGGRGGGHRPSGQRSSTIISNGKSPSPLGTGESSNMIGPTNSRRSTILEGPEKRNSFLTSRPSFIVGQTSKAKYDELIRRRSELLGDRKIKLESKEERAIFFEPPGGYSQEVNIFRRMEMNDANRMMNTETPGLTPFGAAARVSETERKAELNRFTALQRRAARTNTTSTPTSFYDVVDTEAEPQASNTDFSERLAGRITESSWFQNFILFCIIFNTVLSILYTESYVEKNFGRLIDEADSIFLTIYLLEIWLKMIYQKASFWRDNWNLFDFSLILVSVLSILVRDIGSRSTVDGRVLRFLRVLRAFRTLRILGALRKLQVVVNTFLKSLMELTNIVVMILLLIFMFAIMGLQLFQEYSPEYFGTLTQSAMTLFICITQDGWVSIVDEVFTSVQEADVDIFISFIMHAFFIIYITIGAWTMINLISGITVTNWQLYVDEVKAMERARYHDITTPSLRDDQVAEDARNISAKTVSSDVWSKQVPLSSASSVGRISVQKLENYMLVLDALEQNMQEYKSLTKLLKGHLEIIQSTNAILDVPLLNRETSTTKFDGDVLSIQMMRGRDNGEDNDSQSGRPLIGMRGLSRRGSSIIKSILTGPDK